MVALVKSIFFDRRPALLPNGVTLKIPGAGTPAVRLRTTVNNRQPLDFDTALTQNTTTDTVILANLASRKC